MYDYVADWAEAVLASDEPFLAKNPLEENSKALLANFPLKPFVCLKLIILIEVLAQAWTIHVVVHSFLSHLKFDGRTKSTQRISVN